MHAIERRNDTMVSRLLELGADPISADIHSEQTPLHMASFKGELNVSHCQPIFINHVNGLTG